MKDLYSPTYFKSEASESPKSRVIQQKKNITIGNNEGMACRSILDLQYVTDMVDMHTCKKSLVPLGKISESYILLDILYGEQIEF